MITRGDGGGKGIRSSDYYLCPWNRPIVITICVHGIGPFSRAVAQFKGLV